MFREFHGTFKIIHTAQTNTNKYFCWISVLPLLASIAVGQSLFSPDWTCSVSVCWCLLGRCEHIIFQKNFNPVTNLFVGVCLSFFLCGVNWPLCVIWILQLHHLVFLEWRMGYTETWGHVNDRIIILGQILFAHYSYKAVLLFIYTFISGYCNSHIYIGL